MKTEKTRLRMNLLWVSFLESDACFLHASACTGGRVGRGGQGGGGVSITWLLNFMVIISPSSLCDTFNEEVTQVLLMKLLT